MTRRPLSSSYYQHRSPSSRATGVRYFLQAHEKMAAILPAVTRLVALQKECSVFLPQLFGACNAVQFENGQLTVSTPNGALAAKLKQQLPKLQDGLQQRGWQVNAIRIKVQVGNIAEKIASPKTLSLPSQALEALAVLDTSLAESPHNHALKAALGAMLQRHRYEK
jgi:hypothetical protein